MAKPRTSEINYANRTVDLLLLKTIEHAGAETEVFADISGTPMSVTGIEKLVQRYTEIFLTQVGSVKNLEQEGTELLINMSNGVIYDESTLKTFAAEANMITRRQIINEDASLETPDDERLVDSEVISASIDRAKATAMIKVRLTTASGDSFTYITPITTGV